MAASILILSGPNLDLLGTREPEIYGSVTLMEVEANCRELATSLGVELGFRQSNHEGGMVDLIQSAIGKCDAIVINPAGLSFHSIAVRDALKAFGGPVIELHISNIHARDPAHRHSIQSAVATAVICGLGTYGYSVALRAACRLAGCDPVG